MSFVGVAVMAVEVDLWQTTWSVSFGWITPDGVKHRHQERGDGSLDPGEVEGMRRLVQDAVNGEPFGPGYREGKLWT